MKLLGELLGAGRVSKLFVSLLKAGSRLGGWQQDGGDWRSGEGWAAKLLGEMLEGERAS